MKTLGILGGMSWESTAVYYRLVNQDVAARRGGLHSAPLVMASVDFETIAARQRDGDRAGAAALLIATNTMHKVGDAVAAEAGLPRRHAAAAVDWMMETP
jgi:aspartate racemase